MTMTLVCQGGPYDGQTFHTSTRRDEVTFPYPAGELSMPGGQCRYELEREWISPDGDSDAVFVFTATSFNAGQPQYLSGLF